MILNTEPRNEARWQFLQALAAWADAQAPLDLRAGLCDWISKQKMQVADTLRALSEKDLSTVAEMTKELGGPTFLNKKCARCLPSINPATYSRYVAFYRSLKCLHPHRSSSCSATILSRSVTLLRNHPTTSSSYDKQSLTSYRPRFQRLTSLPTLPDLHGLDMDGSPSFFQARPLLTRTWNPVSPSEAKTL